MNSSAWSALEKQMVSLFQESMMNLSIFQFTFTAWSDFLVFRSLLISILLILSGLDQSKKTRQWSIVEKTVMELWVFSWPYRWTVNLLTTRELRIPCLSPKMSFQTSNLVKVSKSDSVNYSLMMLLIFKVDLRKSRLLRTRTLLTLNFTSTSVSTLRVIQYLTYSQNSLLVLLMDLQCQSSCWMIFWIDPASIFSWLMISCQQFPTRVPKEISYLRDWEKSQKVASSQDSQSFFSAWFQNILLTLPSFFCTVFQMSLYRSFCFSIPFKAAFRLFVQACRLFSRPGITSPVTCWSIFLCLLLVSSFQLISILIPFITPGNHSCLFWLSFFS